MHVGTSPFGTYTQGEEAGEEQVTIDISSLAAHNHAFLGTANDANDTQPADGAALAQIKQASAPGDPYYAPDAAPQPLNPGSISLTGGNQPHSNLQPYLAINWCICLYGIYPSRN